MFHPSHYLPLLERLVERRRLCELVRYQLSPSQLEVWRLHHVGVSPPQLAVWVTDVSSWSKGDRSCLYHHDLTEQGKDERMMTHTENFLDYQPQLASL